MENFQTNWKSSDGLEIFAQGWNPDSVTVRAVVCLIHGMGEHTSRYLNVAKAFAKEGFVLFGADVRGHGRSGGPRGHFPSIEVVLKDIDLLLEHARKLYPGLPLILYGHSLGGILVLYYGLKQKPDVKGVISTSPSLHNAIEEQSIKVMTAKAMGSIMSSVSIKSGLDVNALSHDPEVIKLYINDPLVHDKISLGFGKIVLNVTKWTLEHAKEFSLPLLLMHGKADSIAYPSSSIEFAAPLNDACKLVLWEDAYHELHNEPIKDEVYKTMTNWIENQNKIENQVLLL
jgi:alpha-beta hydrolase superfamily lysophospholipase